jgi:carbamoyl-phosphate synthase large subunit
MPITKSTGKSPYHGRKFSVLFTSVGRRVELLRCFREAMDELGVVGRVVAMDLKHNAPARYAADAFELAPRVDSLDYAQRVLRICEQYEVSMVVPLIDPELDVLSQTHDLFRSRGVELCLSGPETTNLSADKRRTASFFSGAGVSTPRLLDIGQTIENPKTGYPLFLKPADGSCSQGAHLIRSRAELEYFSATVDKAILQERVVGDEFTLDVLVDLHGKVRCVVPRQRIETRAGEVSKGVTVKDAEIIEAGRKVVNALPDARGCITVQCFRTPSGKLEFIEINPRFGGGYPLSFAAGANFPKWLIEWSLGGEPEIEWNGWQDGLAMLRYDAAFFVDYAESRQVADPKAE